jgi:hypothetical protein
MTSRLHELIAREIGAGGDGGRPGRTRGPRRRPSYVAHVAALWEPETAAAHLASCRTGRDGSGRWRPWGELNQDERRCWFWEELEGYRAFPPTHEVEVP